jgi:hypothetical protein
VSLKSVPQERSGSLLDRCVVNFVTDSFHDSLFEIDLTTAHGRIGESHGH